MFFSWRDSKNAGLTRETFLACIQTMGEIPDLAMYLQEKHGFSYLLTGKLASDPIEGRFGWYRQVNGRNYFMCVKQLIQAEKKIKVLNLLQQNVLKSNSKLRTFNEISLLPTSSKEINFKKFDWLVRFFFELLLDELSHSEKVLFVSGYVVRSVSRRRKCSFCKEMLVKGHEPTPIYAFLQEESLICLTLLIEAVYQNGHSFVILLMLSQFSLTRH